MALGFSSPYKEDILLSDSPVEQILVLAFDAAEKAGFVISSVNEKGFVAFTPSWKEEVRVNIEAGVCSMSCKSTQGSLLGSGNNKKNVKRFSEYIWQLKLEYSSEKMQVRFQEISVIMKSEENLHNQQIDQAKEINSRFIDYFIPRQSYFITPVLISINILIFILMGISGVHIFEPDNQSLISWGANFKPMTLEGQPWRLFTSCFIHIGIFHLLMNMYAFVYVGSLLEPFLGKTRFLTAYVLTGILASLTSLWWHDYTVSAGASGAIFGMYGVFIALLTTKIIDKNTRDALLASILIFVGYNLVNGLRAGIDNAAHIGGLISGMLIGFAFVFKLNDRDKPSIKYGTMGLLIVLVMSLSAIGYFNLPNDISRYEQAMRKFSSLETIALKIYNLPDSTDHTAMLKIIEEEGIYSWNENIKLLKELENLDLPDELHAKNKNLLKYAELRLKSYELIYKAMKEGTDQYQEELDSFYLQIDEVLSQLNSEVE